MFHLIWQAKAKSGFPIDKHPTILKMMPLWLDLLLFHTIYDIIIQSQTCHESIQPCMWKRKKQAYFDFLGSQNLQPIWIGPLSYFFNSRKWHDLGSRQWKGMFFFPNPVKHRESFCMHGRALLPQHERIRESILSKTNKNIRTFVLAACLLFSPFPVLWLRAQIWITRALCKNS